MLFHGLPLAIEGIVRRARQLRLRLCESPATNLAGRVAEEDGRGSTDATKAEHRGYRVQW